MKPKTNKIKRVASANKCLTYGKRRSKDYQAFLLRLGVSGAPITTPLIASIGKASKCSDGGPMAAPGRPAEQEGDP
jgi:hypothetical protein